MKNILLADDHAIIRKGVKMILETEFFQVKIGEASNLEEILEKAKETKWDILILDMNLRNESGLEILRQLKSEKSIIRTLLFSFCVEGPIVEEALKLGAWGYLEKSCSDQELFKAIRQISNGKKYIPQLEICQGACFTQHYTV